VLTVDISRYLQSKPKDPDGRLYYTKATVLDAYEVLRQFVDATDDAGHCLVVVLAPPALLSDARGLWIYDALRLRISDEVQDQQRPNPLGSLVRVTNEPAKTGGGAL